MAAVGGPDLPWASSSMIGQSGLPSPWQLDARWRSALVICCSSFILCSSASMWPSAMRFTSPLARPASRQSAGARHLLNGEAQVPGAPDEAQRLDVAAE
jgi:hypothetical protein